MTALGAATPRHCNGTVRKRNRVPMAGGAGNIAYLGALLEFASDGYAEPATGASGRQFAGIKIPQDDQQPNVNNVSGSDGDLYANVAEDGIWRFAKSGSITQANIGHEVCAVDDNTVALNLWTLTTNLTGATNNDLVFTAKSPYQGAKGREITIEYRDPGGTSATLTIEVVGSSIIVHLGRTSSAIDTTGDLLKAAIAAHALANAIVSVDDKASNDGSGLVAAMAATALSGGCTVGTVDAIVGSEVDVNIEGWARRAA
jgi:hypothetical protein